MSQALKRIEKDLINFNKEEHEGIYAGPTDESNMFKWDASIEGPENSPYEGGTFNLDIEFSKDYPFKPPKILFVTKIFHPNVCINHCRKICLDILYNEWSPDISISKILLYIQNSLINPQEGEYLLDNEATKLYIEDRELFNKTAVEWTIKFAQ